MNCNNHVSRVSSGALLILVALFASGCFRTVIETPATRSGTPKEDAGVSWIALTTTTTNASECTYGVAKAETYMPAWGVLVYWVTVGIAAPMRTVYTCAAAPKATTGGAL